MSAEITESIAVSERHCADSEPAFDPDPENVYACQIIQRALSAENIYVALIEACEHYSDSMDAGWMSLPDDESAIYWCVYSHLDKI